MQASRITNDSVIDTCMGKAIHFLFHPAAANAFPPLHNSCTHPSRLFSISALTPHHRKN